MPLDAHQRLFVTGATGQLGQLVIAVLLRSVPASQIVAGVRDAGSEAAQGLHARGIETRVADYAQPASLAAAFAGIDRLLLISSSEVGQRGAHHQNVITAAKQAGVKLIAYTSFLHADTSIMKLAVEHKLTEIALQASGVPFTLLRNGYYSENWAPSIPAALAHGVVLGCAGEGRIAAASRADYAEAAAAVLASADDQGGRIYELVGDEAFTLSQLATAISEAAGKPVAYRNMTQNEYQTALVGFGVPEQFSALLADTEICAANGALFDESRQLSTLIGRPTTPMPVTIADLVKG
ncbi:SDR family oxidoreductase [Bosea sp. 685]|uniref:SDR family oxidoreductase n=1 Tax=Bosea sp. 685 TaxID=3080057 RepID=UPI002892B655|nr:SDR family oxidoreductase [Bosea sp. 685]WNJ88013.1 SDR family oxidoreductase [Bosea sp. 685]